MIVTVTLNAAIDRTITVPNFQRGQRHRASAGLSLAGGKGINVARALKALGGSGADIYSLSDAELKATKERMQTVFDKIAESAGEPGKSVAAHLKPYW